MLCELHAAGSISWTVFEDAQVKAYEAQNAYGYDLATRHPSEEDENREDVVDHLEKDAWYGDIYSQGNDIDDTEGWMVMVSSVREAALLRVRMVRTL